jgi:PST family polysaccharide transporter
MTDIASSRNASEPTAERPYAQILRSTALVGASSIVTIAFAIIRTKAVAVLLGPQGVGLISIYQSIIDLTQSLAGLGIQASGVREVAAAAGSGDAAKVARTAAVVRGVSLVLALVGGAGLAAASTQIAAFTFNDVGQETAVALLSFAVLFQLLFAGQLALIQGMRRIGDLARANILAALTATVVMIGAVLAFGRDGIAPALGVSAGAALVISWFYVRKVGAKAPKQSWLQIREETSALIRLGVVFMASAILTFGAAYVIRLIILRHDGVVAAGLYQAAWTLGGLYTGFILQAMGTDFFPRLTGVAHDDEACNRMVNEQAHVSMLLAGPGVIATLTAAPLVVSLFYTPEFLPTADVLRAICVGMLLRVAAWPMGFILLAKGARGLFFWTEVAATAVHVGLVWLLLPRLGVLGAGVAFLGLYVWHSILIYLVVRRLSGFRFSAENLRLGSLYLTAAGIAYGATVLAPFGLGLAISALLTLVCCAHALRSLLTLGVDGRASWEWLALAKRMRGAGAR